MTSLLVVGLLLAGIVGFALSARALLTLRRERERGALLSVDMGPRGRSIYAASIGLVGRPDEVRRLPNGRSVPLELKSRSAPSLGPLPSHVVQVEAYCFLLEESTGVPPPYGVVRYADGREWEIPWGDAPRREVLKLLRSVRRRYDGRATPTPGKCQGCHWRSACDARADVRS